MVRRLAGAVFPLVLVLLSATPVRSADQVILGKVFLLKGNGGPGTTKLKVFGRESGSPNTIVGDPTVGGATLTVLINGVTSTTQSFTLPAANWIPRGSTGFKYKDTGMVNGPIRVLLVLGGGGSTFKILALGVGVNIPAPNTGTYGGITFAIGGGDNYCVNHGGAAGGSFVRNDAIVFKIVRPTSESVCPTLTPTCGDGVVQPPFETCDGDDNDALCDGLCPGPSDPFACLCPFCGDGTIDQPGESCDGQFALGSCTEGCSFSCQCTTCGNAVVEPPVEECETDDDCSFLGTVCRPPGSAAGQCLCLICGDDILDPGEECDGTADAACPDECQGDCTCATTTTTSSTMSSTISSPSPAFLDEP